MMGLSERDLEDNEIYAAALVSVMAVITDAVRSVRDGVELLDRAELENIAGMTERDLRFVTRMLEGLPDSGLDGDQILGVQCSLIKTRAALVDMRIALSKRLDH